MPAQTTPNQPLGSPNPSFWRGKRVLVTGHTGFKGGWLAFWLSELGADVSGLALESIDSRDIFNAAGLENRIDHTIGDIRNITGVENTLERVKPEIVFHLAAQALVRRAHLDPEETYSTNVVGLSGILDAVSRCGTTRALIVATSDKVYENREQGRPFVEDDPLGGVEPYGVSKAVGEFICEAFRSSLPEDTDLAVATVRAGNVIGGGDWAEDRLIPDAMRAFLDNRPFSFRNPDSTRPWQHVFDPLAGYLMLAERLYYGDTSWRTAWNFGPDGTEKTMAPPVREIADRLVAGWNNLDGSSTARWQDDSEAEAPYEAQLLSVDSTKARNELNWAPRISLEQGLDLTLAWYMALKRGQDMIEHSRQSLGSLYQLNSSQT